MAHRHGAHRSRPHPWPLLAALLLLGLAAPMPSSAAPAMMADCGPAAPAARPAAATSANPAQRPRPRRAAIRPATAGEAEAAPRRRPRPRIAAAPRPAVVASATGDVLPGCIPGAPPRSLATTQGDPPVDPAGVGGMTRLSAVALPGSTVMALASVPPGGGGPLRGAGSPTETPKAPVPQGPLPGPVPPTASAGPDPMPLPDPRPPRMDPAPPVVVVPEPGSAALLLAALVGLAALRRRRSPMRPRSSWPERRPR